MWISQIRDVKVYGICVTQYPKKNCSWLILGGISMDFSGDPWNFYGFLGGLLGISMDFLGDSWSFYGFLEIPVFFFLAYLHPPSSKRLCDISSDLAAWTEVRNSGRSTLTSACLGACSHGFVFTTLVKQWYVCDSDQRCFHIFLQHDIEATSDRVQMLLWKKSYTWNF